MTSNDAAKTTFGKSGPKDARMDITIQQHNDPKIFVRPEIEGWYMRPPFQELIITLLPKAPIPPVLIKHVTTDGTLLAHPNF